MAGNMCVGGVQITGSDGQNEFYPFPQGAELAEFLDTIEDPIARMEVANAATSGEVYDLAPTQDHESRDQYVLGGIVHDDGFDAEELRRMEQRDRSWRKGLCVAGVLAGVASLGITGVMLKRDRGAYYDPVTFDERIGIAIGLGLPLLVGFTICREQTPMPPTTPPEVELPRSPGGTSRGGPGGINVSHRIRFDWQLPELSPEALRNAQITAGGLILIGVAIALAPVGI